MRNSIRVTVGILGIILIGIVASACSTIDTSPATTEAQATQAQTTDPTEVPATPEPEPTLEPTIAPTAEPSPEPEPIHISGNGKVATDAVTVPFVLAVLTIRHTGARHFAVLAYHGDDRELLVNEIGNYIGKRWLVAGEYIFDIDADGTWEIAITPMGAQKSVAEDGFSGVGDDVSGLFMPPGTKAWEITHAGDRHFAIIAVCAGGRELIANEIGGFSGSGVVRFPEGPCFFEVSADGAFSIEPR